MEYQITDEVIYDSSENILEEVVDEEDDEFVAAVQTLMSFEVQESKDDFPALKKQKVETKPHLSERQIVHRILGCRHCKSKFGCEADVNIHKKIDDIFDRMKQTVK
jgi:hypothetical protein